MKRVVLLLLLLPVFQASGVELGIRFNLGNLGFDPAREYTDTAFTGQDWFWGGSVEVSHGFDEHVGIRAGFKRDAVLRNLAYALLYYNLDFLSMGLGTIQGINGTDGTVLKPGIASSVQLSFPGVMFARILFDYSLSNLLMETGDYSQNRNEVSIGFYVPNAICSLNFQSKKFSELQTEAEVVDSLMRYSFEADIYKKNSPYRLLFSFAYQTLQKKYLLLTDSFVHTLSSLLVGLELSIELSRHLTLLLGLDSAIYTHGEDELAGLSNPAPYLFQGWTGFTLKFDNLKNRRPALSEP